MPNRAIEKGSQAVMGIGRSPWIRGSMLRAASALQPIQIQSGMPATQAQKKPCTTRRVENSTVSNQVPE